MATAPIINPVVLFATYTAFGNSWYYVLLRFVGAFLIAMILGILLGFVVDDQILKDNRKVVMCTTIVVCQLVRKPFKLWFMRLTSSLTLGVT